MMSLAAEFVEDGRDPKEFLATQQRMMEQITRKSPPSKQTKPPPPPPANVDDEDTDPYEEQPPPKKVKKEEVTVPTTPTKTPKKKTEPMTPEEEQEKKKKRLLLYSLFLFSFFSFPCLSLSFFLFFSKDNFLAFKMREQRRANPLNAGSKEVPEGEPFCLQGLRFAFTGDLQALSREQATDLIRKYGG